MDSLLGRSVSLDGHVSGFRPLTVRTVLSFLLVQFFHPLSLFSIQGFLFPQLSTPGALGNVPYSKMTLTLPVGNVSTDNLKVTNSGEKPRWRLIRSVKTL